MSGLWDQVIYENGTNGAPLGGVWSDGGSLIANFSLTLTPTSDVDNETESYLNFDRNDNGSIAEDYIFDRPEVRGIYIALYSIVFCCCFVGNLLVILVVTLSRRLRSITNFFLANLAIADLCVGVFCVLQNLSTYLIQSWVLGNFLCKMYQFVHSLSYTASIIILVVICTERYFAIIHPITCKQILTSSRLRLVILGVWISSALYSAPKLFWVKTVTIHITNGDPETICIPDRQKYDSKLFDIINFVVLYAIPLLVMMILYTRIAFGLWRSSRELERHLNASSHNGNLLQRTNSRYDNPSIVVADTEVSVHPDGVRSTAACSWRSRGGHIHHTASSASTSSQNVLRARRGVVRMLIVVVLTFALCNLPYHARKMWQYWSNNYEGPSNFSSLFTPLTFLIAYFNSGVNPLLYAFLSRNFRKGMRELLFCSIQGGGRKAATTAIRLQNYPQSHSSIFRKGSSRSTLKNNHTCTTVIR